MAYPESSEVSPGDIGRYEQYNKLRNDALYPILQNFTYGETIAENDTLYLKASDEKVYKTDADFNDERIHNFIGFAKENGNANDVKKVQTGGKVEGFVGLTAGSIYYLSNTAGAISSTPGIYEKKIGIAVSTTEIFINADITTLSYGIGDILLISSDAEKGTDATVYTELKRIEVGQIRGNFRIKFDFKTRTGGNIAYARIYKNGVAIGIERSTTSATYATYSEDITGWSVGDLIQIYGKRGAAATFADVRYFRIYVERTIKPRVILD